MRSPDSGREISMRAVFPTLIFLAKSQKMKNRKISLPVQIFKKSNSDHLSTASRNKSSECDQKSRRRLTILTSVGVSSAKVTSTGSPSVELEKAVPGNTPKSRVKAEAPRAGIDLIFIRAVSRRPKQLVRQPSHSIFIN
jgi:hypothetical protein